ncbi:cysteine-rich receptor-like protein kinase 36 [Helianthus annuus]|uniref:cysteine-rich receptor-like protein kinase 36 n=1 Tax=Helianthus annuus TaxID=4232 RepID=UPI000B903DE9|nr:cysteine-rich receptor-like protein kinase 36 [Helianthus annuus]
MAPEYLIHGDVSAKTDVFSFGMLVLDTVVDNWLEGTLSDIIDPRIDVDSILVTKLIEIGLLCVQRDDAVRPTMEEVVDMLLGTSSLTLPVSAMRGRMSLDFDSNEFEGSDISEDEESCQKFKIDINKFELELRL